MQYVRMLTNSIIAGALVGAYVTLLVLQLNPAVTLTSAAVVRLIATWWVFYGIHGAVFFYVLCVIRQLIAADVRLPGWVSLRLLAEFAAVAASLAAIVTWLNLRGFRVVLGPDSTARMTSGATALTAGAAVCGGLSRGPGPPSRRRRMMPPLLPAGLGGRLLGSPPVLAACVTLPLA